MLLVVASLASYTQCSGDCSYGGSCGGDGDGDVDSNGSGDDCDKGDDVSDDDCGGDDGGCSDGDGNRVMAVGAAMVMATAKAAMATPLTVAVAAMVKAVKTTIN